MPIVAIQFWVRRTNISLLVGFTMIDIFFKKKEIVIDFLTCDVAAHTFAPIQTSIKSIPAWFKSTPKTFKEPSEHVEYIDRGTVKNCYGLVEHFKRSITIPMWSDLVFNVSPEGYGYYFAGEYAESIETHLPQQTNDVFSSRFYHVKLITPWLCKTKEDLHILFVEPFWNNIVCPGLVDNLFIQHGVINSKHSHSVNINLFLRKETYRLELAHKIPLVYLVPLTDKKVKIVNHLVGEREFLNSRTMLPPVFVNKYRKSIL